ncbi:helix-turn-helix transcriptional regulator [Endozoicomonas ascidiicola]|uniref:helix-turn-helix transcriptional regulator n=1 Tax=Endozoicomonas ascidiicola TaxID=1698521 RepID=UPI00082E3444|nr:AlpA family phage regulatory protein [Endozoicomonas ascidiicola]
MADKKQIKDPVTSDSDEVDAFMKPSKVCEVTTLSEPTIRRKEKLGEFPRRHALSEARFGYRTSEVKAWMESRKRA